MVKMYDLIPRSLKSEKTTQKCDFHAGNGSHLEKWPPSISGILLCMNRADSVHQYVFYAFNFGDFVNNRDQKIGRPDDL